LESLIILAIKSRFQLCGSPSKVSAPSQSKQINQDQQQKNNYAASLVYEEGYSSMDSYSTSSYASSMSNSDSNQAEYNILDLDSQPQTIPRDSGITLHMPSDSSTLLPSDPVPAICWYRRHFSRRKGIKKRVRDSYLLFVSQPKIKYICLQKNVVFLHTSNYNRL
jgi:hypothetical protein